MKLSQEILVRDMPEMLSLNDTDNQVLLIIAKSKDPISPYEIQTLIEKSYFIAHKSCKILYGNHYVEKKESASLKGGKKTSYILTLDGFCYLIKRSVLPGPYSYDDVNKPLMDILSFTHHIDPLLHIVYECAKEIDNSDYDVEYDWNPFIYAVYSTALNIPYLKKNNLNLENLDTIKVAQKDFHSNIFSNLMTFYNSHEIPNNYFKEFFEFIKKDEELVEDMKAFYRDWLNDIVFKIEALFRFSGSEFKTSNYDQLMHCLENMVEDITSSPRMPE